MKTDYTRAELIRLCRDAIVHVKRWRNRDTPITHAQLGVCWALLTADCEFFVHTGTGDCKTDERTIWLTITRPTFSTFEYGGGYEKSESYYLPTPQRLKESEHKDWY